MTADRLGEPDEHKRDVLVRMDADLHEAIKAKAASQERSMAQEIRYALKLHCSEVLDGG